MVEHNAADQLDVVVAQANLAPGRLAYSREGLDQQVVERFAAGQALTELIRLGPQLIVVQLRER